MRIVSLLPSATEILYALGLGDSVVGVSHECDFPEDAKTKPAVISARVDPRLPSAEIDAQVAKILARGESLYQVHDDVLRKLKPDLIITQDLCHVCAASPGDLAHALESFKHHPQVLSLKPEYLVDVFEDVRRVGIATGREREAEAVAQKLHDRVEQVHEVSTKHRPKPRVACIEWLSPVYIPGHWVPEMIESARGISLFGRTGQASFPMGEEEILKSKPEIILIMPCGFGARRALEEFRAVGLAEKWKETPAFKNHRIFGVDANSYFSRPGPRLADGVELMATLFHPGIHIEVPKGAFERFVEEAA
jgi:iron complex transport system substrate-binding protein